MVLAQLLSLATPGMHAKAKIEGRLVTLAPADAGEIRSLTDMQARIDELLNAGATMPKPSWTTAGRPRGREATQFRNRLRLAYMKQDWEAIAAATPPPLNDHMEQEEARETLRQFPGPGGHPPDPGPTRPKPRRCSRTFTGNALRSASRTIGLRRRSATCSGTISSRCWMAIKPAPEQRPSMTSSGWSHRCRARHGMMCCMLTRRYCCSRWASPPRRWACSRPSRRPPCKIGSQPTAPWRWPGKRGCRRQRRRWTRRSICLAAHPSSGRLARTSPPAPTSSQRRPFPSTMILSPTSASAIARFRNMNASDQARVLQQQVDPLEGLLVESVRAAADALVDLRPMMDGIFGDHCEDDLNALIKHLLAARVQFLNWSVSDQSKGGYSAKDNPGERDILITRGGTTLSIVEALICDKPLTQDVMVADLESHFQKLLGYGNPRIFFHVTYAFIEDKTALMTVLRRAAEAASPPGFTFLASEAIPHEDSRPPGFAARYAGEFGDVKVVFLVLGHGPAAPAEGGADGREHQNADCPKEEAHSEARPTFEGLTPQPSYDLRGITRVSRPRRRPPLPSGDRRMRAPTPGSPFPPLPARRWATSFLGCSPPRLAWPSSPTTSASWRLNGRKAFWMRAVLGDDDLAHSVRLTHFNP